MYLFGLDSSRYLPTPDIKTHQPGQLFEMSVERPQVALAYLKQHVESWRVSLFGNRLHIVLDHPDTDLPHLQVLLQAAQFEQLATQPIPFSLEDAFIGIVQRARAD